MGSSKRPVTIALAFAAVLAAGIAVQGNWAADLRERLEALLEGDGRRKTAASSHPWKAPAYLTCDAVRERTRDFLKAHYLFRKFDEELSVRSFEKYFQILDPGKNVFLASDIEEVRPIERHLGEALQKRDCSFAEKVYSRYLERLDESVADIGGILKQPFDFSVDESIEIERKKLSWPRSPEERRERWRKLLKFYAMNVKDADDSGKKGTERLRKRYELMRKSAQERSGDEINGSFLNAFALSLDPHSQYLLPEDQDEFKVSFSLQFVGIGASLSQQDGYTTVEAVLPGGAAARDGRLQKGDKIIAVDTGDGTGFADVIDMELPKVVQLIRGKKDTLVRLKILRKDAAGEMKPTSIEIQRDVVRLKDAEAASDVIPLRGKKVGVIHLPSFYLDYQGSREKSADFRSSANDMLREIRKLQTQNVDGIVVDLRTNGGGDLNECVKMTGLFIDEGPVVQVQDRDGDVDSLDDTDSGAPYAGPLALLISKQSASASEILAGALQDYGRALILGNSRTYGKATVQNVIEVPGSRGKASDGAIKVTISKFFRPSGKSNQEKGVPADVMIPDALEASDLGESENDYVLPSSTIQAASDWRPLQSLEALLPQLRQRSEARVTSLPAFKKLQADLEKLRAEKDNTLLSLKATPTPAATPTPITTPGGAADDERSKVVRAEDAQLHEAAEILVDSMDLLGGKTDWTITSTSGKP